MENTKQPDITTDEAPAILRIARHEHVLTARIDDAKSQAEALLARARENAALIERQAAEALEAELEAIRREAAVKRSQLREAVRNTAMLEETIDAVDELPPASAG